VRMELKKSVVEWAERRKRRLTTKRHLLTWAGIVIALVSYGLLEAGVLYGLLGVPVGLVLMMMGLAYVAGYRDGKEKAEAGN